MLLLTFDALRNLVGDQLLYLDLDPGRRIKLTIGLGELFHGYLLAGGLVDGQPDDSDAALAENAELLEASGGSVTILLFFLI